MKGLQLDRDTQLHEVNTVMAAPRCRAGHAEDPGPQKPLLLFSGGAFFGPKNGTTGEAGLAEVPTDIASISQMGWDQLQDGRLIRTFNTALIAAVGRQWLGCTAPPVFRRLAHEHEVADQIGLARASRR